MLNKTIPKIAVIKESTAKDFESKVNAILEMYAECDPELFFQNEIFTAYVVYKEKRSFPEDSQEKYESQGVKFHCANCVKCNIPSDKRLKHAICTVKADDPVVEYPYTRIDGSACNQFYENIDEWLREE